MLEAYIRTRPEIHGMAFLLDLDSNWPRNRILALIPIEFELIEVD
jgi:hypothetical protein